MSACDCDERLIHLVIPRQRLGLALPHQREVDGADAHDFIRVLKLNSPAIGIPEPVRQGAEKAIESLPLQRVYLHHVAHLRRGYIGQSGRRRRAREGGRERSAS